MIEFLEGFFSEMLFEKFIFAVVSILIIVFQRFIRKQKKRDEEQDLLNKRREEDQRKRDEDQDRLLNELRAGSDINIYFEKMRLPAYQDIRKISQEARYIAEKIENPSLIQNYKDWLQELFRNYESVKDVLTQYSLLLDRFDNYKTVHTFKNAYLHFYLKAEKLRSLKEKNRQELHEEYTNLYQKWLDLKNGIVLHKDDHNNEAK